MSLEKDAAADSKGNLNAGFFGHKRSVPRNDPVGIGLSRFRNQPGYYPDWSQCPYTSVSNVAWQERHILAPNKLACH